MGLLSIEDLSGLAGGWDIFGARPAQETTSGSERELQERERELLNRVVCVRAPCPDGSRPRPSFEQRPDPLVYCLPVCGTTKALVRTSTCNEWKQMAMRVSCQARPAPGSSAPEPAARPTEDPRLAELREEKRARLVAERERLSALREEARARREERRLERELQAPKPVARPAPAPKPKPQPKPRPTPRDKTKYLWLAAGIGFAWILMSGR